jgi:hypothetical protein
MSFAPANELEALIYDGDGDAVLEMLAAMPESQRLAQAGRLGEVADLMRYWWYDRDTVHDSWGMRATDGQRDAIEVAMLVCAPADRAASFRLQAERLVAVAERFRPPSLPLLAQALWECSHPAAALQLARAGLSPLELDDEAILRLMAIKHRLRLKLRDYLATNIETLKPVLLKVFELEGTSDVNLAAIDKYTFQDEETWASMRAPRCWRAASIRWSATGRNSGPAGSRVSMTAWRRPSKRWRRSLLATCPCFIAGSHPRSPWRSGPAPDCSTCSCSMR